MPARARRPGNLPSEATSFIGRRHELAEVRQALASARLVSLVGPGGVGKTRLALRAASDLARAYRDGAWLVELAEIRDPDLVWNAVLEALDLRDQATTEPLDLVLSNLADKQLLLVVDNCEHLLESAARLASEVVKTARAVRVLATSREPLSAPGESVVPVPPLDLPSGEPNKPLHQVRENEAVALFMERAASASGRFELTPANLATVVELCRHLDGLPLAIELAAVRTRVLAVDQILDRLGDRFALLTGGSRAALPRHQTLRTTIDWSYDLLTVGEKTLLRRLCVFAGSFSLEDIEAICASPALDDLSSLIDKSLVIREEGGRIARYRLHETMREYALTKLREAGEEESAREKFVQHYVATCERSVDEGAYFLAPWLHWIESEIDNIRLALQWLLLAKDSARGTALAGSAGWFWVTRATTEGVRWLDEFLGADAGDPAALALAYFIRGFIATLQGDAGAAESALTRAALLAPATRRPWLAVQSLAAASVVLNLTGDHARAQPFLDEAQANADAHASRRAWVAVLQARSTNAFVEGDLEGVKAASSECARLSAEDGDLYTLAYSLINLGFGAMFTGETVAARRFFEDGLSAARQIDDRLAQFYLLDALGCMAGSSGEHRLAARLWGAAEMIRVGAGAGVNVLLAPLVGAAQESAAAALGQRTLEGEFKAGKEMSREAALALALGETRSVALKGTSADGQDLLGKREADVAKLVAEGMTNKEIGSRLFISERTVESHVRNILNKLGFNSRAQIASWVGSNRSKDRAPGDALDV